MITKNEIKKIMNESLNKDSIERQVEEQLVNAAKLAKKSTWITVEEIGDDELIYKIAMNFIEAAGFENQHFYIANKVSESVEKEGVASISFKVEW